jgi:hypothetical protein
MSKSNRFTIENREQIKFMEMVKAIGQGYKNSELYPCDRGSRKFEIGDRCELVGLETYPELNGEIVTITNYRKDHEGMNPYYICSESGNVEKYLNFVYEKRLRKVENDPE